MPRSQEVILTNMCLVENDQGQFVMQIRSPERYAWSGAALPGGAMELNESSVKAAVREFAEETGIKVTPKRLLNVYTKSEHVYPNGDVSQSIVFLYEMTALGDYDISQFRNSESLDLRFFSQEEVAQLDLAFDSHRLMLDEYFADSFAMEN